MTKAKEALDLISQRGEYYIITVDSEADETIRKALELLDKVERGGDDIGGLRRNSDDYGDVSEREFGYNVALEQIQLKYILIERDK